MKVFGTYVLMVALPAAGVLGILRAGSGLKAPHAVGGEWRIDSAATTIVVEQSGEHLSIHLPNGEVKARIRGDSVRGATAECAAPFQARIDRRVRPERMTGVHAGGVDCAPTAFTATRVVAPRGRAGGH
ncbi:MAG TPA: hypothetical protein VE913_09435 [Longimicrobium sp.]|nr:hypothetical protein [Longimicrobium sp.]